MRFFCEPRLGVNVPSVGGRGKGTRDPPILSIAAAEYEVEREEKVPIVTVMMSPEWRCEMCPSLCSCCRVLEGESAI